MFTSELTEEAAIARKKALEQRLARFGLRRDMFPRKAVTEEEEEEEKAINGCRGWSVVPSAHLFLDVNQADAFGFEIRFNSAANGFTNSSFSVTMPPSWTRQKKLVMLLLHILIRTPLMEASQFNDPHLQAYNHSFSFETTKR